MSPEKNQRQGLLLEPLLLPLASRSGKLFISLLQLDADAPGLAQKDVDLFGILGRRLDLLDNLA